jgi:hypothetical protein
MADQFIGHDFDAKTFPFRQPVPFEASANSAVPWGQALVNESWDSQAISAGNTGTIGIDIKVPSDYVSVLRRLHLQAVSTAGISWTSGDIGFAYQNPGGPYKTSTTAFPEDEYLWWDLIEGNTVSTRDRFSTAINTKHWTLGNRMRDTPRGGNIAGLCDDPVRVPLWIPPQSDLNLQQRSVIIQIINDSASSSANHFTLNIAFDLYTLEQAYAAGVMSSPRVF